MGILTDGRGQNYLVVGFMTIFYFFKVELFFFPKIQIIKVKRLEKEH